MKRATGVFNRVKSSPEFITGVVCLLLGIALWLGWLTFQLVLVGATVYGAFQCLVILYNNELPISTRWIQVLLRLLVIFSRICLIYLVGINAEPYRIVVSQWNPPSAFDSVDWLGTFLDNYAGYIFFALFQGFEILAGLMLADEVSFKVMLERHKKWKQQPGEDSVLHRAHRLMSGGDIIKAVGVTVIAYLADALFLASGSDAMRFGLLQVNPVILMLVILFGFEILMGVGNWLVGLERSLVEYGREQKRAQRQEAPQS